MADRFWADNEHVFTHVVLDTDDENEEPDLWPEHTELVLSAWGSLADISAQTPHIRKLLAEASLRQTPLMLCWTDAFPDDGDSLPRLLRRSLLNAASSLGYESIRNRLRSDTDYANTLAATQNNNVVRFREAVKERASNLNLDSWQIESITSRREGQSIVFYQNRNHLFPLKHGRPIKEKPFCSRMIVRILHDSFFGSRAVARFDRAMYTSSINEGPGSEEKELPPSMVALAATAAYVRSMEDTRHTSIPFSQPAHRVRYYTYMAKLHEIKNESIEKYHGIMEFLFRAASAPQPTTWRFIAARQWLSRREVNTHGIQRLASGRQQESACHMVNHHVEATITETGD